MDDFEAAVRAEVEQHGWHVILVPNTDGGPALGFTVGLTASHGHPELVVVGLDDASDGGATHELLAAAAEFIVDGRRFEAGATTTELLVDYECAIAGVAPDARRTRLPFLETFYGERPFDVLQIVWPDRGGRFPWDDGCDPSLGTRQPLLA